MRKLGTQVASMIYKTHEGFCIRTYWSSTYLTCVLLSVSLGYHHFVLGSSKPLYTRQSALLYITEDANTPELYVSDYWNRRYFIVLQMIILVLLLETHLFVNTYSLSKTITTMWSCTYQYIFFNVLKSLNYVLPASFTICNQCLSGRTEDDIKRPIGSYVVSFDVWDYKSNCLPVALLVAIIVLADGMLHFDATVHSIYAQKDAPLINLPIQHVGQHRIYN